MIVLELLEGDVALERANILHIHHRPLGVFLAALGVIVGILPVELGVVDVCLLDHLDKPDYPRHFGVAVIEECLLSNLKAIRWLPIDSQPTFIALMWFLAL